MSHPYNRPETALDRTATIIQEARRGDITAHDAAKRVFACLGLSVTAPLPPSPPTSEWAEQGKRAACTPPSPLPPPPSIPYSALTPVLDRIFGAASAIMKMSDLGEAKRYAERIQSWREWFTEQDALLSEIDCNPQLETRGIREAAELLRANSYMVGKVVRKLPPVYAIPPAPRYAAAKTFAPAPLPAESTDAALIRAANRLVKYCRDVDFYPTENPSLFLPISQLDWFRFFENALWGVENLRPIGCVGVQFMSECSHFIKGVIGPHEFLPMWISKGGLRLKDTIHWEKFYSAVKAVERQNNYVALA